MKEAVAAFVITRKSGIWVDNGIMPDEFDSLAIARILKKRPRNRARSRIPEITIRSSNRVAILAANQSGIDDIVVPFQSGATLLASK
ncbi:MAG: hypothetical protein WCC64_18915 [Aliidongia sp.]